MGVRVPEVPAVVPMEDGGYLSARIVILINIISSVVVKLSL